MPVPEGSDARRLGTLSRRSAITTLPMPANFKPASQQLELAVSLEAEAAVAGNRPVGPLISVGRLESD
jgi:anti-sigma-K factor RskA